MYISGRCGHVIACSAVAAVVADHHCCCLYMLRLCESCLHGGCKVMCTLPVQQSHFGGGSGHTFGSAAVTFCSRQLLCHKLLVKQPHRVYGVRCCAGVPYVVPCWQSICLGCHVAAMPDAVHVHMSVWYGRVLCGSVWKCGRDVRVWEGCEIEAPPGAAHCHVASLKVTGC
jgi:hypothetical protein